MAEAAHAVVQEAMDAGVWVFGGGLYSDEELSVVATDGTVTEGPYPESKAYIGGLSVVNVPYARGAGVGCQDRRRLPLCQQVASSCPSRWWATDRRRTWPVHVHGSEQNNRLRQRLRVTPELRGRLSSWRERFVRLR